MDRATPSCAAFERISVFGPSPELWRESKADGLGVFGHRPEPWSVAAPARRSIRLRNGVWP